MTTVNTFFDFTVEGATYTELIVNAGEALRGLFGDDALMHVQHLDVSITTKMVTLTASGAVARVTWSGRVSGRFDG